MMKELQSPNAILRRFEPVIRYTRGERFFPVAVETYIKHCSLWVQRPDEPAELLVPQGELTLEELTRPRNHGFGAVYFLKLIEPPDLIELAKYSLNKAVKTLSNQDGDDEDVFRPGRGRLARVGYMSRLIDALFSFSLLLRGRVPGDTAAAAAVEYQRMREDDDRFCYYGRVVRENGWVVVQYWFFYPFNNWRSGFFGVNDHEGDWEMVTVYCSEQEDGSLTPEWVAYSSHEYSGDDLRRRWDDPEVEKVVDEHGCEHPVIYAGAGSHASYFSAGEYLTELQLTFLSPVTRILDGIRSFWVKKLGFAGPEDVRSHVFCVPFVDYARGDGVSIGPGQSREWTPQVVDTQTDWAVNYRGLWGLYARDPVAGENAPAGPVYRRDGSVRRSWYDPLGWAGLDKLPPSCEVPDLVSERISHMRTELSSLEAEIREKSVQLQHLGLETAALQGEFHLESAYHATVAEINALSSELGELRRRHSETTAKLQALERYRENYHPWDSAFMRSHIRHPHQPSSDVDLRLAWLAEIFAAVNVGLMMIAVVLLAVFARQYLVVGLAAMVGLILLVEASFRRQLFRLINSFATGLAVVSALILIFEFFWEIVVALVFAAALYITWENIREIRS